MKEIKDYQSILSLTDKEYAYLLECYYFDKNDKLEKIINSNGVVCTLIPDNPHYMIWFYNGKRISKEEAHTLIYDKNYPLKNY